jgi:hypothetical protein
MDDLGVPPNHFGNLHIETGSNRIWNSMDCFLEFPIAEERTGWKPATAWAHDIPEPT